MTTPQPVLFDPIYRAKPWGGRRLAPLLNKRLPGTEPIGEAWELASLPGDESRVRGSALAGITLAELVKTWGTGLLGDAPRVDGRFPLLIKYLDACENLSVQVHPKPDNADGTPVKHEAWYILHAEPGAQLYVGLRPGVTPLEVERAANTPAMVDLLQAWPARVGDCYYLPSGTLHALGAGLVVAEVQTPSDVTYRAYDWERVDAAGRPRELHIAESLQNIRYDVTREMVLAYCPEQACEPVGPCTPVVRCPRFHEDLRRAGAGEMLALDQPDQGAGRMRIWMLLRGRGRFSSSSDTGGTDFATGDTALIPADCTGTRAEFSADTLWLEITVPA